MVRVAGPVMPIKERDFHESIPLLFKVVTVEEEMKAVLRFLDTTVTVFVGEESKSVEVFIKVTVSGKQLSEMVVSMKVVQFEMIPD